jgi:predicted nuclease of predicted toxin-antitoxin system
MRILLDECAPRRLKREFTEYEILTVVDMGWSGQKNGELLKLMQQENFTVLLTTDQNLRYQQNLVQAGVAIVVLVAVSNKLADLLPLVPETILALGSIAPGAVIEVGERKRKSDL